MFLQSKVRSAQLTATESRGFIIFLRVAIHHSNACREDFGARLERAQERHGTARHSDEFGDTRESSPQPNPNPGRGRFDELARNIRAGVPILLIIALPQPSIQRSAWSLSCL